MLEGFGKVYQFAYSIEKRCVASSLMYWSTERKRFYTDGQVVNRAEQFEVSKVKEKLKDCVRSPALPDIVSNQKKVRLWDTKKSPNYL